MRQRDVHPREATRERLAYQDLVLRVAVGMQQCDRDRLGLARRDALREGPRAGIAQRAQRPVWTCSLRGTEAALGGRQRRRAAFTEPVQVRPLLAPERDHVGESLGGDERGSRSAALE